MYQKDIGGTPPYFLRLEWDKSKSENEDGYKGVGPVVSLNCKIEAILLK